METNTGSESSKQITQLRVVLVYYNLNSVELSSLSYLKCYTRWGLQMWIQKSACNKSIEMLFFLIDLYWGMTDFAREKKSNYLLNNSKRVLYINILIESWSPLQVPSKVLQEPLN